MPLLDAILGRRSIENPSTPLSDPAAWLLDAMGGPPATSGVRVTRETALTYNPVWRLVNLLAGDVAKLPLHVFRREGSGKVRDRDHPAAAILRRKFAPEITAHTGKRTVMAHAVLGKGGFCFIPRRGDGRSLGLIPLNPDRTWPERKAGVLSYVTEVQTDAGVYQSQRLDPEDVLHVRGLPIDGVQCYHLVQKARESFGLGMAAERYGGSFFGNGGSPLVAIQSAGQMSPDAARNFLDQWNRKHAGLENAHKAALLQQGMTLVQYGVKARDAQLTEVRLFELIAVANWGGVPPHKLGHPTRTAFASLEEENQSYLDEGLDHWLVNWEEECWDKLLSEREKADDTHVIEFNRLALLRANMSVRFTAYASALQNGWMNRDEVRARENLNPIPGGEGEKFFIPTTMALTGDDPAAGGKPAAAADGSEPPQADDDDPDATDPGGGGRYRPDGRPGPRTSDAARAVLKDAVRRMVRRIGLHAERAAKQPAGFVSWADQFGAEHQAVVAEALAPAEQLCGAILGDCPRPAIACWLLARLRAEYLEVAGRYTADRLAAGVAAATREQEVRLPEEAVAQFFGLNPQLGSNPPEVRNGTPVP